MIASEQSQIPAPSFRFGIKSLGGMTLVAGLIFTTINFAGLLYGLLISFGIAILILEIVFFTGVIVHSRLDDAHRRLLNSWFLVCTMMAVVLFVGVCFAGGGKAAAYFFGEIALKKKFSDELGFSFESEMNQVGNDFRQTVRITSIDPGSEFEQAGFLVDDVILDWESSEFFQELLRRQGETMTIDVVTAPNSFQSTQLDKLPKRAVTFTVPE